MVLNDLDNILHFDRQEFLECPIQHLDKIHVNRFRCWQCCFRVAIIKCHIKQKLNSFDYYYIFVSLDRIPDLNDANPLELHCKSMSLRQQKRKESYTTASCAWKVCVLSNLPNFMKHVCSSYGKYSTLISQEDL